MDRNFQRALKEVLKHEGGYVNHPKDPGGPTNLGITLANFRRYVKPKGTVEDLKKLTIAQAGVVYRRQYWDAVLGSELPDGVDFAVFDYAVNSGPSRAIKHLQEVVGANIDGRIGPQTLAKVRAKLPAEVIHLLCDRRLRFLRGLKTWPTFKNGWSSRVKGVRSVALDMSAGSAVFQPKPAPVPVQKPTADGVNGGNAQKTPSTSAGKVAATGAMALVIAAGIKFACSLPLVWRLFDSCN